MSTSNERDDHQSLRAGGPIVGPRTPVRPGAGQGRHVSRIAGMAVAVGLGMAVVSNAGLASADTGDNSRNGSSADSAGASNTPASHTTSSAQDSPAESRAKAGEEAGSAATAGASDKQGGSASAVSSSASTAGDDARDGAVQVSGGAVVTSRPSDSGSSTSSSARSQIRHRLPPRLMRPPRRRHPQPGRRASKAALAPMPAHVAARRRPRQTMSRRHGRQ